MQIRDIINDCFYIQKSQLICNYNDGQWMLQGNPADLKALDITLTLFRRIYRHAAHDYTYNSESSTQKVGDNLLVEDIEFKGGYD
jgi:hypothetical protein